MNLYDACKTREERRLIDAQLKGKLKPRMVYETSVIVPGQALGMPPTAMSLGKKPFRRGT